MDNDMLNKYIRAGNIASQARELAKKIVRLGESYLNVANRIEQFIITSGAKPAFPVNISVNDIAAHYTPTHNDIKAFQKGDLVKVDIGVHIDGCVADTATHISIGDNAENANLMRAAETALANAISIAKPNAEVSALGRAIHSAITALGAQPIVNLSGHSIEPYNLHAGINIPNYDNKSKTIIREDMVIAIEPFATLGRGEIYESDDMHIFALIAPKPIRSGRDVLAFIEKEYSTLPFAKRWLVNKFGLTKASLFLNEAVAKKIVLAYPVLREKTKRKIAQVEHTIIVRSKPIIITE